MTRVTSRAERARSFGEVAEDYDRLRPSPPDAALDWLVPDRAVPEIARVLAPGGCFGALWITRDREVDWVAELDRVRRPPDAAQISPAVRRAGERAWRRTVDLPEDGSFGPSQTSSFRYTRTMTRPPS